MWVQGSVILLRSIILAGFKHEVRVVDIGFAIENARVGL
jgi:hypothetical protein